MEQELQFIQYQLWFVIALFALLIATNVVCYFVRKSEKDNQPKFGDMWDKDQLDVLIEKSSEYLIENPNHPGALYFGAKALIARNKNIEEARRRLTKLLHNEPTLKDSVQEILEELDSSESS
nr:hypothetical protein 4 [Gammaproteobacteria bacterium]